MTVPYDRSINNEAAVKSVSAWFLKYLLMVVIVGALIYCLFLLANEKPSDHAAPVV